MGVRGLAPSGEDRERLGGRKVGYGGEGDFQSTIRENIGGRKKSKAGGFGG